MEEGVERGWRGKEGEGMEEGVEEGEGGGGGEGKMDPGPSYAI